MTVTLDIKPETQVGLLALADASGKSLEEYILAMVESAVHPHSPLSPAERAAAWIESAKRFPDTPPLSAEAISRESIYGDRGLDERLDRFQRAVAPGAAVSHLARQRRAERCKAFGAQYAGLFPRRKTSPNSGASQHAPPFQERARDFVRSDHPGRSCIRPRHLSPPRHRR